MEFKTGFCHFCAYETETKPYKVYDTRHDTMYLDMEKCSEDLYNKSVIYLCEFCCMLSINDRKNNTLRTLNWGLNHILKRLREK